MEIDWSDIAHLNYVVQRNWTLLPEYGSGEHPDVDFFVSEDDREEMEGIFKGEELIDIRSPRDKYYPEGIELLLLTNTREYKQFKIPSKEAHFLSLYYHNAVHKEGDPYNQELKDLFLEIFPAVRCTDSGVGHHV